MVHKKSLITSFLIGLLVFAMTGCVQSEPLLSESEAQKMATVPSAWVVYWDLPNDSKEAKQFLGKLDGLVLFAANFTPDGTLVCSKDLLATRGKLKKGKYTSFLSVVNDVTDGDETVALKDPKIVAKILQDEEATQKHITELINLTKKAGFGGLEIDYENIWKNREAITYFPSFVSKLYTGTQEAGLKLRIVLEPSAPFKELKLVKGPEYVVMFYNLYGLHSGPGPKANRQFIYNTLSAMTSVPEPKAVALSNGGCIWSSKDKPQFITENEAVRLQKKYNVTPTRDINSQCLVYRYREGTTVYDVWYADKVTINQWITWVKQGGIARISLWRLGGIADVKGIK